METTIKIDGCTITNSTVIADNEKLPSSLEMKNTDVENSKVVTGNRSTAVIAESPRQEAAVEASQKKGGKKSFFRALMLHLGHFFEGVAVNWVSNFRGGQP